MVHTVLRFGPLPRGLHDITAAVQAALGEAAGDQLCHVFVRHTSASLIIQECADPDVLRDLEAFFARLIPDGDPLYHHVEEGPDDMPAHVRGAITQTTLTVPVRDGALMLGTWQGLFLWEHRRQGRRREVVVTVG